MYYNIIYMGTLYIISYISTVYHREHNGSSIFYSKWRSSLRLCWNSPTRSWQFNYLIWCFSCQKYLPFPRQWCYWLWGVWEQRRELSVEWWGWRWWWRLPGLSPSCVPGWLQRQQDKEPTGWRSKTHQINTRRRCFFLLPRLSKLWSDPQFSCRSQPSCLSVGGADCWLLTLHGVFLGSRNPTVRP